MRTLSKRTRCELCGRTSRRACGLLEHAGVCGLPDPRESLNKPLIEAVVDSLGDNPMKLSSIEGARAALAAMQKCGAHARSTGQPCRKPPCRGRMRCNLHGGRSTGAPSKTGKHSLAQQRTEHYAHLLLGALSGLYEKMEPVDPVLGPDGKWFAPPAESLTASRKSKP